MFLLRSAVIAEPVSDGPYTSLLTAECMEHSGTRAMVSERVLAAKAAHTQGRPAADKTLGRKHLYACTLFCPGTPNVPTALPDVVQPLSGLSKLPASFSSSGEMKASYSFAVGVGMLAAA